MISAQMSKRDRHNMNSSRYGSDSNEYTKVILII